MSGELYCVTKRNTCSKALHWEICDLDWHFDFNKLDKFGALSSPVYGVDNQGEKLEWRIHMCGENSRGLFSAPKWATIHLEFLGRAEKKSKRSSQGIQCKYSIRAGGGVDKEAAYILTDRRKFTPGSKGTPLRINFDEFFKKRETIFPENTLRTTVNLELEGQPLHTGNVKVDLREEPSVAPTSGPFTEFLYNKRFSDVIISCDGKTFPAHKILLARHSSVFSKMFDADESLKEIQIKEVLSETVRQMLKYIYTGKLDMSKKAEEILRLLECASKFELRALKSACFQELTSTLTDDNVGEVTLAGYVFNVDEKMLQLCRDYCHRRHSHLIRNHKFRNIFKEHLDAFI